MSKLKCGYCKSTDIAWRWDLKEPFAVCLDCCIRLKIGHYEQRDDGPDPFDDKKFVAECRRKSKFGK